MSIASNSDLLILIKSGLGGGNRNGLTGGNIGLGMIGVAFCFCLSLTGVSVLLRLAGADSDSASSENALSPRLPSLLPLLEADAVARQSPLGQFSIGNALVGMHVQPLLTLSNALATVCLRGESLDEGRTLACDKLASQLLDLDETVMPSMMAIAVGSKVGWQPERLQRYRDEAAVAMGLSSDQNSVENPYSCESLARSVREVRIWFSKGERARAREYSSASGKSLAELADEYRKKYPTLIR